MLYVGLALDRAGGLRRDGAALDQILSSPTLRLLPLWQGKVWVTPQPRAAWLSGAAAAALRNRGQSEAFLGLDGDVASAAVDISALPGDPEHGPDLGGDGRFVSLRSIAAALPAGESALLAYAKGILHWHSRHRHCGVCGAPTRPELGGHVRRCTGDSCGVEHFPRTDPAIIVLVHDGDRCLLHRQPQWPAGMWSVLAGFVEPGESLEEATRREVMEETGVRVDSVRYIGSQPWPFPSSLMVGFTARYVGGEVVVDPHELEDARWFSRAEVRADFNGDNKFLPTPDSIARWMMDRWLAED
jgi:NAD+ diphosphatase